MKPPFRTQTGELHELPHGVLAAERVVQDRLQELQSSTMPLEEKLRRLDAEQLLPFITGSALQGEFALLIDIAPGLTHLDIVRLTKPLSAVELQGDLDLCAFDGELLARIRDPRLIFSLQAINAEAISPAHAEMAGQLFTLGRRLTRFRSTTVSWDQAVDRRVWTTNIDTVVLLEQLVASTQFMPHRVRSLMEIGVGGGAISKTLVRALPSLTRVTVTDISPYALMCARRNIAPILGVHQQLDLYLGKGIKTIEAAADLIVVNPPYIPYPGPRDESDPYRGTGLLREIVACGLDRLDPHNPDACICMSLSSLALKDFAEALAEHPEVEAVQIGRSFEVPLKILAVNENRAWIEFLVREHGLKTTPPKGAAGQFPFWHELSCWILRPRKA